MSSESFINRVDAGQPVEATLDAYPDWKIPCKVIAIIPTADRQKSTVKVRVGFDKLDPRILPRDGGEGGVSRDRARPPPQAVTVPKAACSQRRAGRRVGGAETARGTTARCSGGAFQRSRRSGPQRRPGWRRSRGDRSRPATPVADGFAVTRSKLHEPDERPNHSRPWSASAASSKIFRRGAEEIHVLQIWTLEVHAAISWR